VPDREVDESDGEATFEREESWLQSIARAPACPLEGEWLPPAEIAEFRVERLLGRGGSSQVWLAYDTLLDRRVALKFSTREVSVEARTRFKTEALAVARLQHPNVLVVHQFGEIAGRPYLVTQVLSGLGIATLDTPVAEGRAVGIGIDLARGLAAAHRAGVLHRDVKPANAFLCEDGTAKLLDFGLATLGEPMAPSEERADSNGRRSEGSGATIVGTPRYMSPEAWRGDPPSASSDVYSLGALLFELLAGQAPSNASSVSELRERALAGDVADLERLAPWLSPVVVALVRRCLSLHPNERPSAQELCDALVLAAPSETGEDASGPPDENPYRGLLPFGLAERGLFFGREAEIATALGEIRTQPLVLVVGASGAGKSSLVLAGVAPRAEKSLGRRPLVVVPSSRPLHALARAAAAWLGRVESEVVLGMATSPEWLARELDAARAGRLLLVVDQLEEIWTLADARQRSGFLEALRALLEARPEARVVATLRSDFLPRLEDIGGLRALALRAPVVVGPLSEAGLRRAITEPAQRRGVTLEAALVERLIARSRAVPGESLPLLEFSLAELWERRAPSGSTLGVAELEVLGGLEGALAFHADATLARMSPAERLEARRLLLSLVTVEGTRARREEDELLAESASTSKVLEALVRARLVVVDAGERGPAYEVAHEALLSGWPALRAWLDEERGAREAAERVRRAAAAWERAGRTGDALFGERQLGEVDALPQGCFDGASGAFIAASRAALGRARARRWTFGIGVPLGVLLSATAVAGGVRWNDRRQAESFVAARIAEAAVAVVAAKSLDAQVEVARSEAFALYDAGDTRGGEVRWRDALALARRESDAFAAASAPLGLALARAPLDPVARARAADVASLWLIAAERDHEPEVARDLAARLAEVDDDGSRRARLAAPAHLRVTTAPSGARVVLHQVTIDADGRSLEDEGREIELGASLELGAGSYVLDASASGRYATRYPLLLARAGGANVEVPLPPEGAVPSGFVFVPGGVSLLGAPDVEAVRSAQAAAPEHPASVDGFLIGEHEVTYAEYIDFLATLPSVDRAARRPRGPLELTYDGDGTPVLAQRAGYGVDAMRARRGEPFCRPKRTERGCQDWLRFPVVGVSLDDTEAYIRWLASGRVPSARLCPEQEWERAARGADGRLFPHGNALHPGDANFDATYATDADQMGIDEVGSFPGDRSPFGVLDLAGNVAEWVAAPSRMTRGGHYDNSSIFARATYRSPSFVERFDNVGMRVCASAPATR
jgi:eukaryotic-like serine/threonine-protein kinase